MRALAVFRKQETTRKKSQSQRRDKKTHGISGYSTGIGQHAGHTTFPMGSRGVQLSKFLVKECKARAVVNVYMDK